jgi:hypothetical protein
LPPVWREPPPVFATLPVAGAAQPTEGDDAI